MKNVLIIDAPPMLREFLKEKLYAEKIGVDFADSQRDAIPKFLSILPDLVILNVNHTIDDLIEFLSKKQNDPNGKKIPVIMTGPEADKDEVADLVQYGVIKYFTTPIKFDLFFEAMGRVLRSAFAFDTTPCVLDMHLNKDIIFIEIAIGLNREKITILKYKLTEFIENNNLTFPKIILMMSDLSLSYVDGLNFELLLTNLTADSRIFKRNIKILTLDPFVSDFIEGHPNYEGIQVTKNLSEVLGSLIKPDSSEDIQETISNKILSVSKGSDQGSMAIRFFSDSDLGDEESAARVRIAVIDTDPAVVQYLCKLCATLGEVKFFPSCKNFVETFNGEHFSLAITGMFMPEFTGLDFLKYLVTQKIDLPVIVYSSIVQKEVIMQSLKLGASSYLIKPQPSEVIMQKVLEVINAKQ